MFDMNLVTEPQIDPVVLDFPIFPALGNGVAQSVDYGSENRQNWFFRPSISSVGGTYEHPYRRSAISGHTASCGKFSRKSAHGRRKIGGRKK